MRKSRFTEAQIIGMIKEQEAGLQSAPEPSKLSKFRGPSRSNMPMECMVFSSVPSNCHLWSCG